MFKLMSDSDDAAAALNEKIKSMKVSSLPGKNISRAASVLRSSLRRLNSMGRMPDDVELTILKVLQTTSVDTFIHYINHYETNLRQKVIMRGETPYATCENILQYAEKEYTSMVFKGTWIQDAPPAYPAMDSKTGNKKLHCWNCGGSHC
jgi:hypothetical protein